MAMGMQGVLAQSGLCRGKGTLPSDGDQLGSAMCRGVGTGVCCPHRGQALRSKCLVPCRGLRAFGARMCRFGAGIRAKHWGLCAWSCAAFWSTKLCLLPPPPPSRLMGWECTTVPCVCAAFGVPVGGNVVFSIWSCRSGRAEGGCARRAGRDGHTAALCSSPWGWMTCCAAPWAGLTALGTFGALPEPRVH